MRTLRGALVAVAAIAIATLSGPAWAGSPHFIGNHTEATLVGFDLSVDFKEAGLESGSTETITVTADFEGTFQCINGGGSNPNDPKKTVIDTTLSESGEFTAGKNGNVVGTLVLEAPSPADVGFECPPGQDEALTTVSYSNVQITDEDSGATFSLGGPFSAGTPVN